MEGATGSRVERYRVDPSNQNLPEGVARAGIQPLFLACLFGLLLQIQKNPRIYRGQASKFQIVDFGDGLARRLPQPT